MKAPANAYSGSPRPMLGFVELEGWNLTISYSLQSFPLPGNDWTPYVAVFRGDFGWIRTNDQQPATFDDLWSVLNNVKSLRIRGDSWICSHGGDGSEAVYLNRVSIRLPSPQSSIVISNNEENKTLSYLV